MSSIPAELKKALIKAESKARESSFEHPKLEGNYRLFYLYNRDIGVYGNRPGNRWRKTRRQWIEENVLIQDVRGDLVPFKLNDAQRYLESIVLRKERNNQACRIVILKARQEGMSTYIVALAFFLILTHENVRVRIVAHSEGTAKVQLDRARLMLRKLTRSNGKPWDLHLDKKGAGALEVGAPIHGSIEITSSRAPDPGHGETNRMVHMTETSRWQDAQRVAKGIEQTCHEVPGNFVFDETTANGNTGYFHDKFTNAHNKIKEGQVFGGVGWYPVFLPWFVHQSYRMSAVLQRELTAEEEEEVRRTLDADEKILMKQDYVRRGHGKVKVDIDQIAWRRYCIQEKCTGELDVFHEQYPAFPEEAFLASGRNAFNSKQVKHQILTHQTTPPLTGELQFDKDSIKEPVFVSDDNGKGPLRLWQRPIPGRNYSIGVDTSAGTQKSDPCCAMVTDMETQEIVAELHGRWEPQKFGPLVAALGWYFYEAYLGIETHPSAHGLSVYNQAEDSGYKNLYVERRPDTRLNKDSVRKGFSTSEQSKVLLINRIKVNLREDVPIVSPGLLHEMLNATLDENEKIDRKCQNDRIIAYAISLKIRDVAYVQGRVDPPEPKKLDETEAFWEEWMGGIDGTPREEDSPERLYDGVS